MAPKPSNITAVLFADNGLRLLKANQLQVSDSVRIVYSKMNI